MADGYRVSQTTNNYENNFEKRISHTDAKWNHKIKDESLMNVMECFLWLSGQLRFLTTASHVYLQ